MRDMKIENNEADEFWKTVITKTLSDGYTGKAPLVLSKYLEEGQEIPRPESTTIMTKHIGEIKFQRADWRASFDNSNEGFHAVEFEDRFECHIDKVDPKKDPLGHLIKDSPGTLGLIIASAVTLTVGGIVYFFRKKKNRD